MTSNNLDILDQYEKLEDNNIIEDSVNKDESNPLDDNEVEDSDNESDEELEDDGYTDLVCRKCGGTIWIINGEYMCGHCRRKGYPDSYDDEDDFFFIDNTSRTNLTSIPEQTRVKKVKKNKKRCHK